MKYNILMTFIIFLSKADISAKDNDSAGDSSFNNDSGDGDYTF